MEKTKRFVCITPIGEIIDFAEEKIIHKYHYKYMTRKRYRLSLTKKTGNNLYSLLFWNFWIFFSIAKAAWLRKVF